MGAEHMTLKGLAQGYFCFNCGRTTNMYATGHGEGQCVKDADRVAILVELNREKPLPDGTGYLRCHRLRRGFLGKHEDHPKHTHQYAGSTWVCIGRK